MTADLLPPELEEAIPVKDVAPIVAYLCHDSFEENGSIVETMGGWVTKVKVQQGRGVTLKKPHTMEDGELDGGERSEGGFLIMGIFDFLCSAGQLEQCL